MKIYTKTGDDGTTGLIGGSRVRKSDARIDCYGTVDELNAAIGVALVAMEAVPQLADCVEAHRLVQHDLFNVGSHLATPDDSPYRANLPALDETTTALRRYTPCHPTPASQSFCFTRIPRII